MCDRALGRGIDVDVRSCLCTLMEHEMTKIGEVRLAAAVFSIVVVGMVLARWLDSAAIG